jgi:hypothetical protein
VSAVAAPPARLGIASKARLAAEIVLTYARARRLVKRQTLPRTVELLRTRTTRAAGPLPLPDGARDGVRLGAAVVRTLEALPVDSRCLMRSLVLLTLLQRRGTPVQLVIAARPAHDDTPFEAHAWVELDGRPLLAPAADDHGRLLTL